MVVAQSFVIDVTMQFTVHWQSNPYSKSERHEREEPPGLGFSSKYGKQLSTLFSTVFKVARDIPSICGKATPSILLEVIESRKTLFLRNEILALN
jgi:hypothetical protein